VSGPVKVREPAVHAVCGIGRPISPAPNPHGLMQRGYLLLGLVLATSVAATGCATGTSTGSPSASGGGKMRMQMSMPCQAYGGTYDAATKSCMMAGTPKTSASICQMMGGHYESVADVCELGGS
jgi:hypothetical protein